MTSIVALLLAVLYRFVCVWENKRRDKIGAEAFDHAYEDDLTDLKVSKHIYGMERFVLTPPEPTIQIPVLNRWAVRVRNIDPMVVQRMATVLSKSTF